MSKMRLARHKLEQSTGPQPPRSNVRKDFFFCTFWTADSHANSHGPEPKSDELYSNADPSEYGFVDRSQLPPSRNRYVRIAAIYQNFSHFSLPFPLFSASVRCFLMHIWELFHVSRSAAILQSNTTLERSGRERRETWKRYPQSKGVRTLSFTFCDKKKPVWVGEALCILGDILRRLQKGHLPDQPSRAFIPSHSRGDLPR